MEEKLTPELSKVQYNGKILNAEELEKFLERFR